MSVRVRTSFDERVKRGDKYPLLWALHEGFTFEFWLGGFCSLISTILQVMAPFTLRYLIQFSTDAWVASKSGKPAPHIGHGVGLAIGVTAMQVLMSLATNHFIYRGMMTGGEVRAVLIALIYEKSMVISGRARAGGTKDTLLPEIEQQEEKETGNEKKQKKGTSEEQGPAQKDGTGWANGRIVNLMSVDTYRIDQASGLFHIVWTSPVACIITLVVLIVNLTYSALAGFALLVIGIPALTGAVRSLFRRRRIINKITDQRVSLTQEILQSVRFVKFFGWEKAFLERLGEYRSREIHAIQILLAIRNGINAVSMSLPIFAITKAAARLYLAESRLVMLATQELSWWLLYMSSVIF